MEVTFLGTGDAFGSGGRLQACVSVRVAGFHALIDCGGTSLIAMRRNGIDPATVDAVLVSHFHADHFGGLPLFVLDAQFTKRTRSLAIAGPPGVAERAAEQMEVAFRGSSRTEQRFAVTYHELGPSPAAVGPLAVRGMPVVHTPGSEAMGLRVEAGGRTLAYSGDTEWTPALATLADGADLLIAEAYSFEKAIPYHLSYRALMEHRAELRARRIVLTHLGPEVLARLDDVELEHAHDGLTLTLGQSGRPNAIVPAR